MRTVLLLHLLCWVYWLGGDLGTFYASRFVADRSLSPAARGTALRIMMGVDLAPRICMPLTLASGLHLATLQAGLVGSSAALSLLWLGCLGWLALAVWLHHAPRTPRNARIARWDFMFRAAVACALAAWASAMLALVPDAGPPWLGLKLLCFAAAVGCGLAIRVHLQPFGPAFAALVQHGPSAEGDDTIARSLSRCRPWVVGIWGLLLLSAAIGLQLIRW